jgi:hypothetical protein
LAGRFKRNRIGVQRILQAPSGIYQGTAECFFPWNQHIVAFIGSDPDDLVFVAAIHPSLPDCLLYWSIPEHYRNETCLVYGIADRAITVFAALLHVR